MSRDRVRLYPVSNCSQGAETPAGILCDKQVALEEPGGVYGISPT
jgi:hypothetical protein